MNIENAKSQMRKGMLEYCVLLLLKHRPSYASDIIQQLKNAELLVVEGTLYPLLTRLKNDGLLQYEWQESTQGPPRKSVTAVYRVAPPVVWQAGGRRGNRQRHRGACGRVVR